MSRYIDADKLVEKYERVIEDEWNKKTSPTSWAEAYDCVIADIDDQPTADVVEVRHGEWKDRYENKYANHYYECSVCGKPALDRTVNNELGNPRQEQALSPFCSNCGAKMDGERREE